MIDSLVKELTALYNGGDVDGFIIAQFLPDALTTGWLEQGITHRMIPSDLTEKDFHSLYLIPGDRLARLAVDLDVFSAQGSLFVLLGPPGTTRGRLVGFVGLVSPEQAIDVIWWTRTQSTVSIAQLVSQHLLGQDFRVAAEESSLDYIEQMRTDIIDGHLSAAVAVTIPRKPAESGDVVTGSKELSESEAVPLARGDLPSLSAVARLFPRWVTQLNLFRRKGKGIASCIMVEPDSARIALWDHPRGFATFAMRESTSISSLTSKYLIPLWTDLESATDSMEVTRSSPPSRQSSGTKKVEKVLSLLEKRLEAIDIVAMQKQLDEFEKRIEEIEKSSSGGEDSKEEPVSVDPAITKKFRNIVSRLEEIAERLDRLEDVLKKMAEQRL